MDPQAQISVFPTLSPRRMRAWVLSHCSRVWLFATPWTTAYQAPVSMGFSRQEYWSGLPCPSPGDLPDPGIEPKSPVLASRFFATNTTWEAQVIHLGTQWIDRTPEFSLEAICPRYHHIPIPAPRTVFIGLLGCSRGRSCKHPVSLATLIGNLADGIFLHCSDSPCSQRFGRNRIHLFP